MDFLIEYTLLVQAIVFVIVTGSLLGVAGLLSRSERLIEARVRGLMDRPDGSSRRKHCTVASVIQKLPHVPKALLPNNEKARTRLQSRLGEAGIAPAAAGLYVAAKCLLALLLPAAFAVAGTLGWLSTWCAWLAGGIAGLVGIWLPHLWLDQRRSKRQITLRRALPDFLDLIVACLGGGLSVQAALKQVAEELKLAHAELSAELSIVLREIELGRSLDAALQQLAARTGLEELRTLCSFVHQTTKFGTTITDALAELAEMLRIQREQRAEELAQKAAVKILFPTLLFIFPTVFVVLAGPAAIQIQEGLAAANSEQSPAATRK